MTEFNWLDISNIKPHPSQSYDADSKKIKPNEEISRVDNESSEQKEVPPSKEQLARIYKENDAEAKSTGDFKAKDIMSSPVHFIESTLTVQETLALFDDHRYEHFPVCDAGRPVAMISYKQILEQMRDSANLNEESFLKQNILKIARAPVLGVHEDASLKKLATMMFKERFEALPVLDLQFNLKGIITRDDILKFVVFKMPYHILA